MTAMLCYICYAMKACGFYLLIISLRSSRSFPSDDSLRGEGAKKEKHKLVERGGGFPLLYFSLHIYHHHHHYYYCCYYCSFSPAPIVRFSCSLKKETTAMQVGWRGAKMREHYQSPSDPRASRPINPATNPFSKTIRQQFTLHTCSSVACIADGFVSARI